MTHISASALFQPYLLPHERIVWTGQPRQGVVFVPRDLFLVPFSLFWAGFAVFWNLGVWGALDEFPSAGAPLMFKLFGLPFLVAGVYIVLGRFIHDAAIRRNTVYALTDQRVLFLHGSRFGKFKSSDLDRLAALELTEFGDGSGTIAFDSSPFLTGMFQFGGWGAWLPSLANGSQFFRIDRARQVYTEIRDITSRR